MITLEHKHQLVAFGKNLKALAESAPDEMAQRDLYKALHYFRKRYCKSYAEKKAEVQAQIADGAADVRDLVEVTGYRRQTIDRILRELAESGDVEKNRLSISKIGRPQYFYTAASYYNRSKNN